MARNCDIRGAKRGPLRKEYQLWDAMHTRCRSRSSYKDCSICERWDNFSKFVEDLPNLPGYKLWKENKEKYKYALDKDIIKPGNRVYGPDTCCFVLSGVNTLEVTSRIDHVSRTSHVGRKVRAYIISEGKYRVFNSRKDCEVSLNLPKGSVSRAINYNYKGKNVVRGIRLEDWSDK